MGYLGDKIKGGIQGALASGLSPLQTGDHRQDNGSLISQGIQDLEIS